MLLSTASSLFASVENEIWINERGNVEMVPDFYMDLINESKYNSEMYTRLWEIVWSEREAHDKERQAAEVEREKWKQFEAEVNAENRMQEKYIVHLENALSIEKFYTKILTVVAIAGVAYGVSQ